jgi:IMP cyclohydrolase
MSRARVVGQSREVRARVSSYRRCTRLIHTKRARVRSCGITVAPRGELHASMYDNTGMYVPHGCVTFQYDTF